MPSEETEEAGVSTCASLPAPLLSQQKVSLSWPREAGTGFGEGVMEVIFDGGEGKTLGGPGLGEAWNQSP